MCNKVATFINAFSAPLPMPNARGVSQSQDGLRHCRIQSSDVLQVARLENRQGLLQVVNDSPINLVGFVRTLALASRSSLVSATTK